MRRNFWRIGILCICLGGGVFAWPGTGWAELKDEAVIERMEQMESRIKELESRLSEYETKEKAQQRKTALVEARVSGLEESLDPEPSSDPGAAWAEGIAIGAGGTLIYQFTDHANGDDIAQNGEDVGDASYSVDLEVEKSIADSGRAFLHLETGDGAGVDNDLKLFSSVNSDADDSDNQVQVTEFLYEYSSEPLTVTLGKLSPTEYLDHNEYANDECTQFLGGIFKNSPTIEFPDNAGGLHVGVALNEAVDIDALVMDGDSDWDNFFDNGFFAGQVDFKPELLGLDGHYRVLGWVSDREHTKWDDLAKTKEKGYGFGVSFDQEVTEQIGLFARYSWQNPEVFLNGEDISLEQSFSVGMQCRADMWGRENDVAGFAFGGIIPSDDYKKSDASLKAAVEYHLESYYNYKVNDHVSVSPDLQVIWNPYGRDAANGDKTVVVGGLRTQIDF